MIVLDYLLKFCKISLLESFEKLFDYFNYFLIDIQEIVNMYCVVDYCCVELVFGGKLFDVGQVFKFVW